ncbi:sugar ABC transporter ATP-binding protein [Acidisoma silvae]|uniref:Sugar ABC transporter ATP-binding protein n=1 Tax=Acidisoma silvae TaxID=2802396 RepID=A0A964DXM6_9PROT|nr:sugar ABC transporter ATP-binding protein [Acidisoma silvae]MCB8874049.1 sugar ABC transporter ATP-binding protein [Acidisoma silvae]
MSEPILSLAGVTKSFAGVRALVKGEIDLYPGEVTALIGENGAGKSTLVKILTGVHHADGGDIRFNGEPVHIGSADNAGRLGISAIHQEAVVFDDLSVAENIFVTDRPRKRGMVDWATMRERARVILAELDPRIDPRMPMRQLSVAQKHLVQIARALSNEARIVIMDEPTAALSHREVEELFTIVRRLKAEGRAILFISHKFEEIFDVADRFAVFRDGAAVGQGLIRDVSRDQLIAMMVGRSVDQVFPKTVVPIGEELFHVAGLSRGEEFADVSFGLKRGEILGVYGLVGAGRSEVMQAIFGLTRPDHGEINLEGRSLKIRAPEDAIGAGIAYVPEDRQIQGGILRFPIASNIALPSLSHLSHRGFMRRADERALAEDYVTQLQIKTSGVGQRLEELSGGNQQKVVIAKWLATNPRVLIMDEPTKGIDVGAKTAVYRLMGEIVARGLGIIMISSELPEVMGLADRILVMRRGRLRATFTRAEATPESIVKAATDA